MRVTQSDIADVLGLDVSSVNKILNRTGGVFRESTVKLVRKAAKKLGWKPRPSSIYGAKKILRDVRDVFKKVGTAGEKLSRIWMLLGKVS